MTIKKERKIIMGLLVVALIVTILHPTQVNAFEEKTTETICAMDFDYIDIIYGMINVFETINANSAELNNELIIEESSFTEQAVKFIIGKVWDI